MFPLGSHLNTFFNAVNKILWKKSIHFNSFLKEIFFIYFEHNRDSIESYIHELKNIKSFPSMEHGPKSKKVLHHF